jgi:hypothetical protein
LTAIELEDTSSNPEIDLPNAMVRDIAALLRARVLALTPADIGGDVGESPSSIWGLIVETAHPDAVASLVVLVDGSVSLYVSDGSGCVGCGANPEVNAAGKQLLEMAARRAMLATATDDVSYPPQGSVRFYFLVGDGLRSAQVRLEELNATDSDLAALYFAGQRVISASERVGAGQSLIQEIRRALQGVPPRTSDTTGPTLCWSAGNVAHRLRI